MARALPARARQVMEAIQALLGKAPQGEDVELTMPKLMTPRLTVTLIVELSGVLVVAAIGEIHPEVRWVGVLEMKVDIVLWKDTLEVALPAVLHIQVEAVVPVELERTMR